MTNGKATLVLGSVLSLQVLSPAMAQTTSKEVAVPATAKDHQALADTYRKKAASYREDAAMHRQMLDTYKKQVAVPTDAKAAVENPWTKRMRVHCEAYIRDAESLAVNADKFAEFHALRAAELAGK